MSSFSKLLIILVLHLASMFNSVVSGIARNLLEGGTKEEVWGTEVPHRCPGAEPRWSVGAKPPETGDTC